MAKTFAANRLLLGVDTWAQEAASPNAGGGTAAAAGSLWLEAGSFPTTPVEVFLNIPGNALSWTRENLYNLNVYNVMNPPFNAVGNGIADDTAALNSAVTTAAAAGGGIIYLPAPHIFKVTKPASGLGSIILDNKHNIVFVGDGPASQLLMIGSANAGDWYLFRVRNGSSQCGWYNFYMDGIGVTSPDPASQNHLLEFNGPFGDALGGPHDMDVVGCYFGQIVGDAIRNLAETIEEVKDIRILYNTFNMANGGTGARSCIEAQRYSYRIQVDYNWMSGSHDQLIDFEPTGGSGLGTAGPEEWSMRFNHMDNTFSGGLAVTLSGAVETDPSRRNHLCFNTIYGGDGILGINVNKLLCQGNVIVVDNTSSNPPVSVIRVANQLSFIGNITASLNASGNKSCFSFAENATFDPDTIVVSDNVCRTKNNLVSGGQGISSNGGSQIAFNDNIVIVDSTTTLKSVGINAASTANSAADHISVVGNLIVGTTTALRTGVNFHAVTLNMKNCLAAMNHISSTGSACLLDGVTGGTFVDWRGTMFNNAASASITSIETTSQGTTINGPAGPGPQQTVVILAGGPSGNVAAPSGSLCNSPLGAAATALFYKESGSGVSGGTAGWFGFGASEVLFACEDTTNATANRFMAPGMGLAVAITTEIKIACPRPGTIRNLRVKQVAGTGAGTISYTFRLNAVDKISQGLLFTATVVNVGTAVVVAAGDLMSVRISKNAIPATNPTDAVLTVELV